MIIASALETLGSYILLMRRVLSKPDNWSMFGRQFIYEAHKLVLDSIGRVVEATYVIPLEIDLSGMSEARERRPLARTVTPEGMTLELLDMRAGQDGSLECGVYIENHTGHEVEPDVYGRIKSAVNGCGFATPVSVIGIGGHRWNRVGDGMGWYGSVVFEAPEEGASDPLEQAGRPRRWSLRNRSITRPRRGSPFRKRPNSRRRRRRKK